MVMGSVIYIGNDIYNVLLRLMFVDEYIIFVILIYVNNVSLEYWYYIKVIL